MKSRTVKQIIGIATYCIILVAVLLKLDWVITGVKTVFTLLIPLFIGFCLAFVLNRPYLGFRKLYGKIFKKNSDSKVAVALSIIVTYILFIVICVLIFWLIIPQTFESIKGIVNNYQVYWEQIQKIFKNIENFLHLDKPIVDISSDVLKEFLSNYSNSNDIKQGLIEFLITLSPNIFNATVSVASSVISFIFGFAISIYLLASRDRLLRQSRCLCYAYTKKNIADKLCHCADVAADTFGGFIIGRLIDAAIIGVLTFIGLTIFGYDYAILISVIVAVTNIIPIIGPFLGGIPSALLILIAPNGGLKSALLFAVFIIIVQQLDGNIIGPKVVGNSVGLPAVWTMVAVILGGGAFGILGALIAVPLLAVIYKLVRESAHKKLKKKHLTIRAIVSPDGSYGEEQINLESGDTEKTEADIEEKNK